MEEVNLMNSMLPGVLDERCVLNWHLTFKRNAAGSIRIAQGAAENFTVSATEIFEAARLDSSIDMQSIAAVFVRLLDQESAELQLPGETGRAFYDNLKRWSLERNGDRLSSGASRNVNH